MPASSPLPVVAIVLVDACRYFENGWTQQLFNRMHALGRSGLSIIVRRARNVDGQARSLPKAVGIGLKTKGLTRSRPTWCLARERLKECVNAGCWIFNKIISGSVTVEMLRLTKFLLAFSRIRHLRLHSDRTLNSRQPPIALPEHLSPATNSPHPSQWLGTYLYDSIL